MTSFCMRTIAGLLAGLPTIAQPGPCPCWLFTLWRIEAAAATIVIDTHAGHAGHEGHDAVGGDNIAGADGVSSEVPIELGTGDPLRAGVQIPPVPVLASSLLAHMALRSIHWRVLSQDASSALAWRPSVDPPPPRITL